MTFIKMYPSLKQNHLLNIKHGKLFLPYFNTWIGKSHQNGRVLTNVLGEPTSRFKVKARARSQMRGHRLLLINRIPIQARILICNYLLQHEVYWSIQTIFPICFCILDQIQIALDVFLSCMHPCYIYGKPYIFVYNGMDSYEST